MRPRVLLTPWRRTLPTPLDPECDLYTLAPDYTESVRRAGGLPIIAPHCEGDEIDELLEIADAVIATGGRDMDPAVYGHDNTASWKPSRRGDDFDIAVVRGAHARGLPVLGICRGAQVVNVALGGDLVQEIQAEGSAPHPTYPEMAPQPRLHRHDVTLADDSRLARIYGAGCIAVNSLHHQAIDTVAEGLRVTATAPDGVVEAVEGDGIVAVQWHPEMLHGEGGEVLFADLVERARSRATMSS